MDFYIEQINKVRDRPEKLKPYLKDVFNRSGGLAIDIKHLKFSVYRSPDSNTLLPQLDDIAALFGDKVAYPRAIVDQTHGKVKAAFDTLFASGGAVDEESRA